MKQRKIGALLSYFTIFLSIFVSIVYTPFLIKQLGTSEHGLFMLVNSIVAYFTLLDFGMGNTFIKFAMKFIKEKDEASEKKLLGVIFLFYSSLSLLLMIIGLAFSINIRFIFGSSFTEHELTIFRYLIILGTLNIAISFIFKAFNASLVAHQEFIFTKTIDLLKHIINPLTFVIILILGNKSIPIFISMICLNFLYGMSEFIYFRSVKKLKMSLNIKGLVVNRTIFTFSFYLFLAMIVDRINWSIGSILLGIFYGTSEVSIFSISLFFTNTFLAISSVIAAIFFPVISMMEENNPDPIEYSDLFNRISRLQFILISFMTLGFILFGRQFLVLWAGNLYSKSYLPALILLLSLMFPLSQNIGTIILQAKNAHKFRSLIYLLFSIVNIIISIPLTLFLGLNGAAIGTAVSFIVGNLIVMNIYYSKKIKISISLYWSNVIKILIKISPTVFISLIILWIYPAINWVSLAVNIFLFSLIFVLTCWIYAMNDYEKNLILTPIKRFLQRR